MSSTTPTTPPVPTTVSSTNDDQPDERGKGLARIWIGIAVAAVVLFGGFLLLTRKSDTVLEKAYSTTCLERADDQSSVPTYAQVGDDGKSLTLDGPDENSDQLVPAITFTECALAGVHRPDYVWSQMQNTTSLMGQQSATWDNLQATWSYHPDNGFDVVLHVND